MEGLNRFTGENELNSTESYFDKCYETQFLSSVSKHRKGGGGELLATAETCKYTSSTC